MNPTTLFSTVVLSVLIRVTLCYVNPKFQACEPQTCGNGQSITYPFYIIDKQQPFCGFPHFGLLCASNGFPMLNLSNMLYIVDEIFYNSHSLRVSNPNFPISNSTDCLFPFKNLALYGDMFTFAPNQKEVWLLFDCDASSLPEELRGNRVGCFESNKTRSVLGLAGDDEEKLKHANNSCRGELMKTTVENVEGGIRRALERGFVLNWTASECNECKNSGGRCGFDLDAHSFRCFCRDRDHLGSCHPGLSLSFILSVFLHYHVFVLMITAAFS